jgi:hypothetical protein
MLMKRRVITALGALAISEIAAIAAARTPLPIDPPTTPPCMADGTCYPNQDYWGHYPGRWRQWPGVELTPTPSSKNPTPAAPGGDINVNEPPTPEKEDVQAPPSSTHKKPEATAEPKAGEGGGEKGGRAEPEPPNLPGLPPLPMPKYETPPTVSPKESTSDSDPPPPLPFAVSAYGGATRGGSAYGSSAATATTASRKLAAPVSPRLSSPRPTSAEGDPPPAPSFSFRSAAL